MQEKSDAQLLRDYAELGNEAAFRELVRRHTDFVYSAALRQVNSPDLAGDIAQGVFSDLARKARPLAERAAAAANRSLAGWLHRSTRYAALNHLRDSRRRVANERQAMDQLLTDSESSADWEQVRPALDEALDSLSDEDREALLLRYFKNQEFRVVGLALGVSDDAAQKRVSRAVERLREYFSKHGVTVGATGLAAVLSANAVQAAPAGLAATLSAGALADAVAAASPTAVAAKTIAMTTLQKIVVTTTVGLLAAAGIYEFQQAAKWKDRTLDLQQQQEPMARQIQQLQRDLQAATHQVAAESGAAAPWSAGSQLNELLRLRGQVGALRQQLASTEAQNAGAFAALMNAPAQKELIRMQLQQALHERYDPLVGRLNIPPETADKIGDLFIENELRKKDWVAALIRRDLDLNTALQQRDQAKKELDSQVAAIAGDTLYAELQQFDRDANARDMLKVLKNGMGSAPLNDDQSKRLQNLLASQPGVKPGVDLDDVDLFRSPDSLNALYQEQFSRSRSLLQQAESFLTPQQLAAAQAAQSSYWNDVHTKMLLYQQLVDGIMKSTGP